MPTTKVAIIGSGNIGTDLMVKVLRSTGGLELAALVGIDPTSDGLARARRAGVVTIDNGVTGLISMTGFDDVGIILDATSARAHEENARALAPYGKQLIDLTPAALGPFVVPAVNIGDHLGAGDLNMVTCAGQATVPVVASIAATTPVLYAEIVATIASRSAGPGTRANVDEFTQTTARALEQVGGAQRGKAIIVLNPAEPPLLMRNTVVALVDVGVDEDALRSAIGRRIDEVAAYVPGYRLKQPVQFQRVSTRSMRTLVDVATMSDELTQVSVFLEVEGAADYLPAYAGNLDIMTSAALRVAELVGRSTAVVAA